MTEVETITSKGEGLQFLEVRKGSAQGPFILSVQMENFSVGAILCRHLTPAAVADELERMAASLRRSGGDGTMLGSGRRKEIWI